MHALCTVVSCKYAPPHALAPPPPPPAFLVQSPAEVFYPVHKPPPEEDLSRSRITEIIFIYAIRLSTIKVSTANKNRPHQRWTRQLLHGSTLLSHPSTLKLVSLPLASGASLCLAFSDASRLASTPPPPPPPPPTNNNGVMLYRKGGCNRERNCCIPHVSLPLCFVLRLRLQKGGCICGTLR